MGIRGEVFSTKVILQNRTYFFNVKENRMGDLYLNIVESKNKDTGGFERQSVVLFADDLPQFLKGFEESLKVLEKSVRGQRQSPRREGRSAPRGERENRPPRDDRPSKYRPAGSSRPPSTSRASGERHSAHSGGSAHVSRSGTGRESRPSRSDGTSRPKRVVRTKKREDDE